jgi:endonuclease/exonuclease/phosphatase (EEP) superfamily protein YafD
MGDLPDSRRETMNQAIDDLDPAEAEQARRRSPRRITSTVLLLVFAVPFLGWAALRLFGLDSDRYTSALVALSPYAVPLGLAIAVVGLVLRRWLVTLVVGVATIALVLTLAPRMIRDSPAAAQGTPIRVLSANMHFGDGDAARIVDLVRRNEVDVLSIQELTPELASALNRAGLAELLPHRVFHAEPGAEGTGIASRYPLRELALVPPSTMHQPSALVDLPGGRDVEFVAVHPIIPVGTDTTADWSREIGALPDPSGSGAPAPRVLAGDFNATLDHAPLRALLGRGYADAAELTGDGLRATWPGAGVRLPPPVTIDHVLVSGGVAVQGYESFDVNRSDHRAILARLVLPR